MNPNLSHKADDELQNIIKNYRDRGATDQPLYLAALEELTNRRGKGLEVAKSLANIRKAAEQGRFLSFKSLADESGVEWGAAHHKIGGHLYDLNEIAVRRGWPMLSAIVVNQPNISTGHMEPDAFRGFVSAAILLKRFDGGNDEAELRFVKDEQRRVFEWGKSGEVA